MGLTEGRGMVSDLLSGAEGVGRGGDGPELSPNP